MNAGSALYVVASDDNSRKFIRLAWKFRNRPQVRSAIKAHARVIRLHRSHADNFASHNGRAESAQTGIRSTGFPVAA